MPCANLTIVNSLGLHARAAAKFVQTAAHYGCDIVVTKDGKQINGKSIMGVMMLAAAQGAQIEIRTSGPEDQAALDALTTLIAERFGESS